MNLYFLCRIIGIQSDLVVVMATSLIQNVNMIRNDFYVIIAEVP